MIYTNHSIRSTSITTWDESNIAACHICGVSGHKSEETIRCYSKKCLPKKKREMADIISAKIGNPPTKNRKTNFDTINMDDFHDWVPIENNKDDFDLVQMIEEIKKQNAANAENPGPLNALLPVDANANQGALQPSKSVEPPTQ